MKKIAIFLFICLVVTTLFACQGDRSESSSPAESDTVSNTASSADDASEEASDDLTESSEPDESSESDESSEPDESSESGASSETYDSLDEYLDLYKDEILASTEIEGLDVDILARNNSLVYKYSYEQEFTDEQVEAMRDILLESLESLESVYAYVLEDIQKYVPSAESVFLEYYTKEGELIASREYK